MNVTFPRYKPKFETYGEPPNVVLAVSCPLCGKEVTRRAWVGFEPQSPESWVEVEERAGGGLQVSDASSPEVRAIIEARLKDSREDQKTYWAHLVQAHPELGLAAPSP